MRVPMPQTYRVFWETQLPHKYHIELELFLTIFMMIVEIPIMRETSISVLEARLKRAVHPKTRLWAMIRLAETLVDKDAREGQRALSLFSEAERLAESVSDKRGIAAAIYGAGHSQLSLYNFAAALTLLKRALPIAEKNSYAECEVLILLDMGQICWRQGHNNLALEILKKCMGFAELIGNTRLQASALDQMGATLVSLGRFHEALECHAKSLSLLERSGLTHNQAITLIYMSDPLSVLGEYSQSLSVLERSLQLCQINRDSRTEGFCLNNIGAIYSQLGDYKNAFSSLSPAEKLLESTGDKLNLANVCANLMLAYWQFGNTEQATNYGEKSLRIFEEIGYKRGQILMLVNFSEYYFDRGHEELGMRQLKRALIFSRKIGSKDYEFEALIVLAKRESNLGNFLSSEKLLQDALDIASEIDDPNRLIMVFLVLGNLFNKQHQPDRALPPIERAIAIAEKIHLRRHELNAHQMLAETLEEKRDFKEALKHWKVASTIREEILGMEKQKAITAIQIREAIDKAEREKKLLKKEVKSKSQEVGRIALELTERTELIRSISVRIKKIISPLPAKNISVPRSFLETMYSDINRTLESKRSIPAEFQIAYRDLLRKLTHRFPTLSTTECRVCILLRNGLSTKEIADMLKVTPRAIDRHRLSIRKKMQVKRAVNLSTFLAGL